MNTEANLEYEEQGASLLEYINVLRRRKKLVAIVFAAVLFVSIALAFLWPATYQSESVILIQGQDVPSNLVQTTITSYAQQRIEQIKARIMTTSNIMDIAERFELYTQRELERKARTEIANEFRDAVSIEPISADVIDPQSGRAREAVIAFSLAFEGGNPGKVRNIANELTELFLNENLRERTEQTQSTSDFLKSESELLLERVEDLEGDIAAFKEENKGGLPEFQGYNISVVDRTEGELRKLEFNLKELEKRRAKLDGELAILSPTAPVTLATGESVLGDADRLKALESEYRKKSAIYKPGHPDLARLKREIDELIIAGVPGDRYDDKTEQLRIERDRLAGLSDKYTEDHPEIAASKRVIEQLEDELKTAIQIEAEVTPDNPAYLIRKNEFDAVERDIRANIALREELGAKLERHQAYVSRAPQVEKALAALLREQATTQRKYNEIRAKLMHAELAQNLESEQKGERFTLIQPAELPKEPVSPNRPAIVFLGLVLALAAGVGSALAIDLVDGRVYGARTVANVLGVAPLITVGYMESTSENRAHNRLRLMMVIGAVLAIILFFIFFHNFVKPLDVTWYVLMRRLGWG